MAQTKKRPVPGLNEKKDSGGDVKSPKKVPSDNDALLKEMKKTFKRLDKMEAEMSSVKEMINAKDGSGQQEASADANPSARRTETSRGTNNTEIEQRLESLEKKLSEVHTVLTCVTEEERNALAQKAADVYRSQQELREQKKGLLDRSAN